MAEKSKFEKEIVIANFLHDLARGHPRVGSIDERTLYSRLRELAWRLIEDLKDNDLHIEGPHPRTKWRHKRRGTTYTEIGRGELQTHDPGALRDGHFMVVYRGEDGQLWIRAEREFLDGRFELSGDGKRSGTPSGSNSF